MHNKSFKRDGRKAARPLIQTLGVMIVDHPSHSEFVAKERQKLVALCRAMLSGEVSFFEGAVKACSLRHNIEAPENDPDLQAFVLIESEADHLPLKDIQHRWSAEAIERLKPEFEKTEQWAKPFASVACENLIKRFAEQ